MKVTTIRVNKEKRDRLITKDGRICGETEKKANRMTLLSEAVRASLERGDWDRGLCVRRFSENVCVRSLPSLQAGDELYIGGIGIRITEAGKSCFPECAYVKEGTRCPLVKAAFFAEIIQDGEVRLNDSVRRKGE